MEARSSTNLIWHHTNPSNCWLAIRVDNRNYNVLRKISDFATAHMVKENISTYKPRPFKNLHITVGFAMHSEMPHEMRAVVIKKVTEDILAAGITAGDQNISMRNLQLTRAGGAILLYLDKEEFSKIQQVIRKTLNELIASKVLAYSDISDFSHKPHITLGNLQYPENWHGLKDIFLPDQRKFSDASQIRAFNHAFSDFKQKQLKSCTFSFPLTQITLMDADERTPVATIRLLERNPLGPASSSKIEHERDCTKQTDVISNEQTSCHECHHTVKIITVYENIQALVESEEKFMKDLEQTQFIDEMKTERLTMTPEQQSALTVMSLSERIINFDKQKLTSTINKRLLQK